LLRRASTSIALALLSACCVASCSGGGSSHARTGATTTSVAGAVSPAEALARVRHAIAYGRTAGSARFSNRVVLDVSPQEANIASEGVVDFAHRRAQWMADVSNAPGVPGGVRASPDLVLTVREIGPDMWVRLPAAFRRAHIRASWLAVPSAPGPGATAAVVAGAPRVLLLARFERPDVAIDLLRTARSARRVGPANTGGVATTQYAADVKLRELLDDVGLNGLFGNPTSARDVAALDRFLTRAVRVDVFLDARGRLRSMIIDTDLTVLAPHFRPPRDPKQWRELRVEWEFSDYGSASRVTAPTAGVQVIG
jgi:hypothetical protein